MINKELLKQEILTNHPSNIFNINLENEIVLNDYIIKKYHNFDCISLYKSNGLSITLDHPGYIFNYINDILDIEFNTILVGGLGLGITSYLCQSFANVDVVEIDKDIIDIVSQLGHLNESVNIINDDVYTFIPNKTYDIILLDIWHEVITEDNNVRKLEWWDFLNEEKCDEMISKYLPFVNEGGFLYIPINKGVIDNKLKIFK